MSKDVLISGMHRVGRMLTLAERSEKPLPFLQYKKARKIIGGVREALAREKKICEAGLVKNHQKRRAVISSIKEGLLSKEAANKSMAKTIKVSTSAKKRIASYDNALNALTRISKRLRHAANLDALDKGHRSSEDIKEPKRDSDKEAMRKRLSFKRRKISSGVNAESKRLNSKSSELVLQAKKEKDAKKRSRLLSRAKYLRLKAKKLGEKSCPTKDREDKEKSSTKRTSRVARRLALRNRKKISSKDALSNSDRVLLADGSVGIVSSINADKIVVSVAGKEKEVAANTVKKISEKDNYKKNKQESVTDRINRAIKTMGSKKKTADDAGIAEVEVEVSPEEGVTPKATPVEEEKLVSNSEFKAIDFVEGEGWVVNKSNNEVLSFGDDKKAAEDYVRKTSARRRLLQSRVKKDSKKSRAKRIADKIRAKKDGILDSAQHNKAEGSENIVKKMKDLTQKNKGYGKTTKDEKVDPQISVANKRKSATTHTKEAPVDSATTKKPGGSISIVDKIKGLTQKGRGYGQTRSDQKINPDMGVYAKKARALSEQAKKQAARLMELESSALVDRAIKAGAITEADRSEQQQVLAELYKTSKSEFDAYARLVGQMENSQGKEVQANRVHKKIANSMASKRPLIVDASDVREASLEDGTFFE